MGNRWFFSFKMKRFDFLWCFPWKTKHATTAMKLYSFLDAPPPKKWGVFGFHLGTPSFLGFPNLKMVEVKHPSSKKFATKLPCPCISCTKTLLVRRQCLQVFIVPVDMPVHCSIPLAKSIWRFDAPREFQEMTNVDQGQQKTSLNLYSPSEIRVS